MVPVGADVTFNLNGPTTSAFTHTPGLAPMIINVTGAYQVLFGITAVEPNQFALFLNNVIIAGSIYGSGDVNQQNSGVVVFFATAGDALTLRNHLSSGPITLPVSTGGTILTENASITIVKLN